MTSKRSPKRPGLWLLWIFTLALGAAWMSDKLNNGSDRSLFLPGQTSYGHHQIEMACSACHTESFADRTSMQEACESCHLEQLKAAKDDHPKRKFTDPRNAERVALLDARYCVTCHVEHRPEITSAMGVTMPGDFCHVCHKDIAQDRPSHEGMAFDTCASAGCHNFHDNRALYEDFLLRHLDKPDMVADFHQGIAQSPQPNLLEVAPVMGKYPLEKFPFLALSESEIIAPKKYQDETIVADWLASAHAEQGVNCNACHNANEEAGWESTPNHEVCAACHEVEVDSFLLGKHGMRLDSERHGAQLSAMSPGAATLPMQAEAADMTLGCSSCHGAHRYDVQQAATDGCLTCHADDHSKAFKASPHFVEQSAQTDDHAWTGLTCAGCHMPVVEKEFYWGEVIWQFANHNQSENFLPNEKMIRPVCMQCHGLEFSINALADRDLIERNFNGRPQVMIKSMELARARLERAREAKEAAAKAAQENKPAVN